MSSGEQRPRRLELSRRSFLQLAGASGFVALVPLVRRAAAGLEPQPPIAPFLTVEEYDIVRAATARIFPSDTTAPGALEAGVADYIQGMLSVLPAADANCDGRRGAADFLAVIRAVGRGESDCPAADVNGDGRFTEADVVSVQVSLFQARPVHAGGPFSGRQPFVDPDTLMPSDRYPRDSFLDFAPLNRVQRIAWEARIKGTENTPQLSGNPLATGVRVNLRQQYRDGLALIESQSQSMFGAGFVALSPSQQSQVLASVPLRPFLRTLRLYTAEGLFSAPEYGGNRNGVGWTLIGYGGDSQPLGYTLGFDEGEGVYVEREDRPNSRPNPGETCAGLSDPVFKLLKTLLGSQPAYQLFSDPFCFGVES